MFYYVPIIIFFHYNAKFIIASWGYPMVMKISKMKMNQIMRISEVGAVR